MVGAGALLAGLCAGALTLALPPWTLLLAPLIVAGLWIVSRWPEYGILAILLYTSTILSEDQVPPLSIGVGSLHLSDLLMLWLFAILIFRIGVARDLQLRRTPLDVPVFVFVAVCIGSTAVGVASGDIAFQSGVRDLRHAGYLAVFFLVTNLMDSEAQMRRLWDGVMLLACLTAAMALLQTVLGPEVSIVPGRVEALYTQGTMYHDIARVIPPGESLIYVAVVLSVLKFSHANGLIACVSKLAMVMLVSAGLVVVFRRALWGSAALAIIGGLGMVSRRARARILCLGLAGLAAFAVAVAGLSILAPDSQVSRFVQVSAERVGSIFDPNTYSRGDRDTHTLEQRAIELSYALPQVIPPSLFGIGLGASYRPCLPMDPSDCENPKYIHNGYVAILLKLGLTGFLTFVWIFADTFVRGFRFLRQTRRLAVAADQDWTRSLLLGCILSLAGLLPALLLEPYFLLWHWTPVIAIVLATVQWLRVLAPVKTCAAEQPTTTPCRAPRS